MKWHAVIITQDSASGIPYQMSVRCDSCRRSIPRSRVDSMKLCYRVFTPKSVATVVGLVTAAILVEAALCYLLDPGDGQC